MGEGMEKGEFSGAREDLAFLEKIIRKWAKSILIAKMRMRSSRGSRTCNTWCFSLFFFSSHSIVSLTPPEYSPLQVKSKQTKNKQSLKLQILNPNRLPDSWKPEMSYSSLAVYRATDQGNRHIKIRCPHWFYFQVK